MAMYDRTMIVLGIETSCDETAAAVVRGDRTILANVVFSQLAEHRPWGGVVPEIAARAHLDRLDGLVAEAMATADIGYGDLEGVAATAGPGLIGGLLVGMMTGKAIATVAGRPFLAVNHLEAHALTPRLTDGVDFPYLVLLVSGGHCQLLVAEGIGRYRRLGGTVDDAVGEAFDKTAKLLGLGWPGGPEVERAALQGDPARFALPRPMKGRPGCDFSFAGLKTAVRHAVAALPGGVPAPADVGDLSASFQAAVGDVLVDRTAHALAAFAHAHPGVALVLVVAGGVAANKALRARLAGLCEATGARLVAPPPALCTDNAAMIAWAGIEMLRAGRTTGMDARARPRWSLDETAA